MTFFAKRSTNGANGQAGEVQPVVTDPGAPGATLSGPPPMADAMLRKMLGVGLSDLQQIADQAGQMLARFDQRLTSIEAQNLEILARLEYLAMREKGNGKS